MIGGEGPKNPFPGLRPFEASEEYLFFGREVQADEILSRLRRSRFLVVIGSSGSGKSSLMRAGVLPALYGGFMSDTGSHWRVAVMRPGNTPIQNLAEALDAAGVLPALTSNKELRLGLGQAVLERGALGLIEALRQSGLSPDENVMLLVDQFEELFRYDTSEGEAFVRLLLAANSTADLPLYIVLTMRSDFIGDCARFHDLPETINDSLFLVPRMTRRQLRMAIEGPLRVSRASIDPVLVTRLLNELGDDDSSAGQRGNGLTGEADQLPILQHVLMRTWDFWHSDHLSNEPIGLRHYEATGGLHEALSRHADEVYATLPDDRTREVAQRVFRCVTLRSDDGRGIRRPTALSDIAAVTGCSIADVRLVVEVFRGPGCSFLTPTSPFPLRDETVIDVSHESLMHLWGRLDRWAKAETLSAQTYRRIASAAALFAAGQAALWRDPDLSMAQKWRARERPTRQWADRYTPGFENAMSFLDRSARARAWDARKVAAVVAFIVMLAAGFVFSESQRRNTAHRDLAQQVANLAQGFPISQLDVALPIAVEATEQADTPDTLRGLYALLQSAPRLRRIFHGFTAPTFSSAGTMLAMVSKRATANEIVLWDPRNNASVRSWSIPTAPSGPVAAICFADHDRFLAIVTRRGAVLAFDPLTGKLQGKRIRLPINAVTAGACVPNSGHIAVADQGGTILVADVGSQRLLWQRRTGTPLWSVAAAPSGDTIAAGGDSGVVSLFAANGEPRDTCHTHAMFPFQFIAFDRDEGAFMGARGNDVRGLYGGCGKFGSIGAGVVNAIAPAPVGIFLALPDGTIIESDKLKDRVQSVSPSGTGDVVSIVPWFRDSAGWLAAATDRNVNLYVLGDAYRPLRFKSPKQGVFSAIAFGGPADSLIVAAGPRSIHMWSILDAKRLFTFALSLPVLDVLTTRSGKLYFPVSDGTALSFDWTGTTLRNRQRFEPFRAVAPLDDVALSGDDSTLVAISLRSGVAKYSLGNGAVTRVPLSQFDAAGTRPHSLSLSPHGEYVVATTRGSSRTTIDIYRSSGAQVANRVFPATDSTIEIAGFSQDDQSLMIRNNDALEVLNLVDGTRRIVPLFVGANDSPTPIVAAMSPDHQLIAVAVPSGGIQLYNAGTTQKIGSPLPAPTHDDAVAQLRFSADGNWLGAITAGGQVRVWEVGLSTLQRRACEISDRILTRDEWATYGIPFPYEDPCGRFGRPAP